MKTVALAGTFDTKREELLYVKQLLEALMEFSPLEGPVERLL